MFRGKTNLSTGQLSSNRLEVCLAELEHYIFLSQMVNLKDRSRKAVKSSPRVIHGLGLANINVTEKGSNRKVEGRNLTVY